MVRTRQARLGLYERAGMSVRVATEAWVTPLHLA